MNISTDDNTFKQFLNTLCHNCLTEQIQLILIKLTP
jgi:hypothetical protein